MPSFTSQTSVKPAQLRMLFKTADSRHCALRIQQTIGVELGSWQLHMLVHLVNRGFGTCNLVAAIMKCAKVHTFILHFAQEWVLVLFRL
jgi:hypothetical protein